MLWLALRHCGFYGSATLIKKPELFTGLIIIGPMVRLGPNEIGVNYVDGGVRTIYPGCFEKYRWDTNMFEKFDR